MKDAAKREEALQKLIDRELSGRCCSRRIFD
jgi:hypothetical protein